MNREEIIFEANKRFPQFRLNRDYSIGEDREKQAFIEGALWSDDVWSLSYEKLLLKYETQKKDFEKRYKNLKKKINELKMNTSVMFSSKTDMWATPQDFFDELNREFNFTLDPCANDDNHKCALYYTKEQDGLVKNWGGASCLL